MADFNVKEIQSLKFRIQVVEQLSVVGVILMVLGWWYSWEGSVSIILTLLIIFQIIKWRFRKQLKQKEYLARVVEERTIELRVQRDQVMKESKELADALEALAEAQDELVRSERLATVGNLTKGLLDRILNPVNYINNFADLSVDLLKQLERNLASPDVKMSEELHEDTMELITMITENLTKITEHGVNTVRIVKAMEELMKDQKAHMVPADVNNLCKVNLDIISKQYHKEIAEHNIKLSFDCLTLSLMIDMNIEQMSKVLIHLLNNSMYALLKKAEKQTFSPEIAVKLEKQNSSVSIKVYDNGNGIEESIKDKIFEPFFTTKPTSLASGTGLYLSREIVLNHKGSIQVESEKDQYTEVTVILPIYQNTESNG